MHNKNNLNNFINNNQNKYQMNKLKQYNNKIIY